MPTPALRKSLASSLFAALSMSVMAPSSIAIAETERGPAPRSHQEVVSSVANMVSQASARGFVRKHGLNLVNVMWEDTGRYIGSSVGPNISDVTIEVEFENARSKKQTRLMPVIRYPNFSDKTGDIDIDKFMLKVGNEKEGRSEDVISLRDFLSNPGAYMSLPDKGKIRGGSLLAKRDDKVLVSAQSTFLPIRKGGSTRFWPVIFNYQSFAKHPAVLTLLVTRQGTSMTIIDNSRDTTASWGQRLYFNHHGQRAPLTAERLADVQSTGRTMNGESAASLGEDSNLLMLIQVPLKVKSMRGQGVGGFGYGAGAGLFDTTTAAPAAEAEAGDAKFSKSDVDVAVLGHGPSEGPYTELDGLTIERDARFPVRVTVQFYQATSNGVVTQENVDAMAAQIAKVYKEADYVGSLVVPTAGDWKRSTMWTSASSAPITTSWRDFAGLRERYEKFGWAGLLYREDMVTGVYSDPPNPAALVIADGLEATLRAAFPAAASH